MYVQLMYVCSKDENGKKEKVGDEPTTTHAFRRGGRALRALGLEVDREKHSVVRDGGAFL